MEKSIRPARVNVKAHDRWDRRGERMKIETADLSKHSRNRKPAETSRGNQGKGKRETDYFGFCSQAMCLQKPWP